MPGLCDTSTRIFKDDPDSDLAPRADTQEETGHSQTHIIQGITRQENERYPKNTPQVLVKTESFSVGIRKGFLAKNSLWAVLKNGL